MKTNYSKYRARAKKIEKRIGEIKSKYPDFDFMDANMRWDLQECWQLQHDLIYTIVDANMCKHENPSRRCYGCICHKSNSQK
jgi:hypothetical protein